MSRPRASLVSSAILCSLSSEIVIIYLSYQGILRLGGSSLAGSVGRILPFEEGGCCGRPEQLQDATNYIDAKGIEEGEVFLRFIFR